MSTSTRSGRTFVSGSLSFLVVVTIDACCSFVPDVGGVVEALLELRLAEIGLCGIGVDGVGGC